MDRVRSIVREWPVVSFVALTYALTWSVWWPIPRFSGGNTALTGVLMGVMVGPSVAAVLLDRLLHGRNAAASNGELLARFGVIFALVLGLDLWMLSAPHPPGPRGLPDTDPAGLSLAGIVGAVLAATVVGGVFAAASSSRNPVMASLRDRRLPPRWAAVALLLPAAVIGGGAALGALAWGDAADSPLGGLAAADWVPYMIRAILYTLLVVSIGEEVGWRGFMLPHLLRTRSPLVASIILGFAWAVWHMPVYLEGHLYGGGVTRVLERTPDTIGLAIIFTWLFIRARGHLVAAILLHTAVNNTPRLLPVNSGSMVAFAVLVVVLIVAGRMWRRIPAAEQREWQPPPDAAAEGARAR